MSKSSRPGRPAVRGARVWVRVALAGLLLSLLALTFFAGALDQLLFPQKPGPQHSVRRVDESSDCHDRTPEMCDVWHKAGLCRARQADCRRTCGHCPGDPGRVPRVSRAEVCRRDNLTAAMPKGHLNAMFERLMKDFPQHRPVAISRDPWLVQLHDIINEEEAQAFISSCEGHFERSLAGDQLNPVRTSYQCWCNFPGCFMNEQVHRVVRRIHNLTGTAFNNGEDLQVVRYEPNQFYKVHHDQNTATWTPQGPRVLTFFMYLNTPEEGGGTRFPLVGRTADNPDGVTISPIKGSAVLWPSVYDDRPLHADPRTNHEAMPVIHGVKYGANMWLHQFDFKTPSERGCKLTYVNTVGTRPTNSEYRTLVDGFVPTHEETEAALLTQAGLLASSPMI